ncbi:MAG: phosphotransferase [Verrucomicrobia bacterium]|nr:phosphotransferase [Verrucomicrobiota bacterium]
MDDETILALARGQLPAMQGVDYQIETISRGGSDRQYFRLSPVARPVIFCQYGSQTPENARFARHTDFLAGHGVPVPRILARDLEQGRLWIEDLGAEDLWSFREADWWVIRRPLYEKCLAAVGRIHAITEESLPPESLPPLGPEFNEALYQWEQDYFFDNFVARFSAASPEDAARIRTSEALGALRTTLASRPRCLIHRDFQSQNILIRQGDPVFIDYQGLRFGLAEYDLASLLYDPYVVLYRDQREELTALAEARSRNPHFRAQLLACACQRLMQALGAYGFLGVVKNKPTFLRHIRPALANLREVAVEQGILPILEPLLSPGDSAL